MRKEARLLIKPRFRDLHTQGYLQHTIYYHLPKQSNGRITCSDEVDACVCVFQVHQVVFSYNDARFADRIGGSIFAVNNQECARCVAGYLALHE
jgi:hypothetical protein